MCRRKDDLLRRRARFAGAVVVEPGLADRPHLWQRGQLGDRGEIGVEIGGLGGLVRMDRDGGHDPVVLGRRRGTPA